MTSSFDMKSWTVDGKIKYINVESIGYLKKLEKISSDLISHFKLLDKDEEMHIIYKGLWKWKNS